MNFQCLPSDLKNKLDGVAFKASLGEFSFMAVPSEGFVSRLLERGGCHRTGGHPLDDGGNLCDLSDPSSENKMEPGTCDGVGWGNEAVGGDCGDWIKAGGESGESAV